MPQFVLLFYDLADEMEHYASMDPAEMEALIGRYVAWSERMAAEGRLVMGEKLKDMQGRVLRRGRVTDGPYMESKEIVGGITVLRAASYDEAVGLCRDHPHRESGGAIEIREVEPIGVPEPEPPLRG